MIVPTTVLWWCGALSALLPASRDVDAEDTRALCGQLATACKKDPRAAVRALDRLAQSFADLEETERKRVVKAIEGVFKSRKDEAEGVEALFIAAAASLSVMGSAGDDALKRSARIKHIRARPMVFGVVVEAMGQQSNPAMVPEILTYLKVEKKKIGAQGPAVSGAARALRFYRRSSGALRKKAVERLIETYSLMDRWFEEEREEGDGADPRVEVAFNLVEVPVLTALEELTGASLRSAPEWAEWWPAHRDEDWDDARDEESRVR